jgi:hypothetical protein
MAGLCFLQEIFPFNSRVGAVRWKKFYGDVAIELGVLRLVHHAHPPFTELFHYFVT